MRRAAGSHVKIRGFKVFLHLVEQTMLEHPQVKTAWVAAIGDNDQEMRLEVCVPTPVITGNLGQSWAISRDLA